MEKKRNTHNVFFSTTCTKMRFWVALHKHQIAETKHKTRDT